MFLDVYFRPPFISFVIIFFLAAAFAPRVHFLFLLNPLTFDINVINSKQLSFTTIIY